MSLKSKIQQELAEATEINPSARKDETIQSQEYLTRLVAGVADLKDKEWAALSTSAQNWYNACADAIDAKRKLPDFPDLPKAEEEEKPASRRRGAAKEEAPAEPKVGDEVKVTTKRGKEYTGELVEISEKENLVVIKTDDGEEELNRDRIESIEVIGGGASGGDEPDAGGDDAPADPAVGDTVQIKTKRGKVIMCKITELDGDTIVYETPDGETDDIDQDRIESIEVKSRAKAKDEPKKTTRGGGRSDAKAEEEDKPNARKAERAGKGANGGVSVTTRMRQLICENPDSKKEDVVKLLKKENLEFKEGTFDIAWNDTLKIIGILRELGWKEPK